MPRKKNATPTARLNLTADQIATLREALDSWLYESAPENYRNDGSVLDPRLDVDRDRLTLEDRGVISLLDEHDEIERLLVDASEGLRSRDADPTAPTFGQEVKP